MTPVKQTIFGSKKGNCLTACFASMLNIPVDHVPNWGVDIAYSAINMFLSNYGFYHVSVSVYNLEKQLSQYQGYFLLFGESFSEICDHAVIYKDCNLFFDPMPNGKGLKGLIRNKSYYEAMFFVPKEI